ncbi:class I SAM-dependent methyltransferase [Desulfocurvibacter africanus]|uniref:class I SAM-dependent methyltransferase n=1 Tax=Desulfocurvibacter africanus TaxID=873 RepID=UPI00187C0728|nr:methyltransferase domain-containing protein [Desulfocurvibacter africanus]
MNKPSCIDFFNKIGIRKPRFTRSEYVEHQQRFGSDWMTKIDLAGEGLSGKNMEEFYKVKNSSLDYAIAINSLYYYDFYRQFLEICERRKQLFGDRILDLGCDIGITTCFYAWMNPESQVFGIDIIKESTLRAQELANRLSLKNVKFECASLDEFEGTGFDTVVSTAFVHEAIGVKSIASEVDLYKSLTKLAQHTWRYMSDSGVYISCERLVDDMTVFTWIDTLRSVGFGIDSSHCGVIKWKEMNEQSEFRLVLAKNDLAFGNADIDILCKALRIKRPDKHGIGLLLAGQ